MTITWEIFAAIVAGWLTREFVGLVYREGRRAVNREYAAYKLVPRETEDPTR